MTTNGTEERPLPDGWMWTTVGDIANVKGGKRLPKGSTYVDVATPYAYIRVKDFTDKYTIDTSDLKYIDAVTHKAISRYTISKDDVYISIAGTIGKVGTIPEYLDGANLTENAAKIIDLNKVDKKYLTYALSSESSRKQINKFVTSSNQPKLALFRIAKIEIPLAPLPEQERIVAEIEKQFTRLDQAVASLRRLQSNLARYKASVLKAACEGRLVPQDATDEPADQLLARILAERRAQWEAGEWQKLIVKAQKKTAQARRKAQGLPARAKDLQPDEWETIPEDEYARFLPKNDKWKEKYKEPVGVDTAVLPELPEGWTTVTLAEIIDSIQTGPFGSSLHKSDYVIDGIPVINPASIIDGKISPISRMSIDEDTRERLKGFILRNGDVIMGRRGEMGRSAMVTEKEDGWLCGTGSLILRFSQPISRQFMVYLFGSESVKAHLGNASVGTTMQNLNQKILLNMVIGLPPEDEQKRIVAEVERRLSVVAATEQAITANFARAERLRQSILHQAFTGQLVPQQEVLINAN